MSKLLPELVIVKLKFIHFFLTVGYDRSSMVLEGSFVYEKENQRTLPFNVDILELPQSMRVYRGSSSERKQIS